MARREKEYKRISRRGRRYGLNASTRFFFSHLWQGKNHLLMIRSNGYSESYKRFYYADIQSITLTRTSGRAKWNIFFLCMAAFFAVLAAALYMADSIEGMVFFAIVMTIFLVFSLINSLRGPCCRCFLTTAVQTEELIPWSRIRGGMQGIDRLKPLILAAQNEKGVAIETAPEAFAPPSS